MKTKMSAGKNPPLPESAARDKLTYEQHPPAFTAESEVRRLRDGMKRDLVKRGISAQRIAKMETALPTATDARPSSWAGLTKAQIRIATREGKKKQFEDHAAKALFFAARFELSVKEENWRAAAYYSYQVGRHAQRALEREVTEGEEGLPKMLRKQNNAAVWQEILPKVKTRIVERKGHGSAKELHAHLRIEECYKWNLKKFSRAWTGAKISEFKTETLRKFAS